MFYKDLRIYLAFPTNESMVQICFHPPNQEFWRVPQKAWRRRTVRLFSLQTLGILDFQVEFKIVRVGSCSLGQGFCVRLGLFYVTFRSKSYHYVLKIHIFARKLFTHSCSYPAFRVPAPNTKKLRSYRQPT
jgi:hypothetical protein